MSVSFNGSQEGFFSCKNGVRQGDPLSPLLFCLAEDVLSRGITKLVENRQVKPIKASRNSYVPSHVLYNDDIMLFCNGDKGSIEALTSLFRRYAWTSGQQVSPSKSIIYAGSISSHRHSHIAASLGFNTGQVPFTYLGAPIFRGRPKPIHFHDIADRTRIKLLAWKASLLSVAGRWARNFIWSGNIDTRKLVTVAWDKCCRPFEEGGLGIRSLITLNEAANLKLCWDMKASLEDVKNHSSWLIGNGGKIHFWTDSWNGSDVVTSLFSNAGTQPHLKDKAATYIQNRQWSLPRDIQVMFPMLVNLLSNIHLSVVEKEDFLVWTPATDGILTLKYIRVPLSKLQRYGLGKDHLECKYSSLVFFALLEAAPQ
ncbi:uncharacterized protein LOC131619448 [Vicia villosa]|uniref:uncharacterized protein LOC131619448 n=1 Tax=Vicia villosa TaxID=3911 RepID=UPI00273AF653|nr:uncharacterized protein LOC131619448 [Vicia villosa]